MPSRYVRGKIEHRAAHRAGKVLALSTFVLLLTSHYAGTEKPVGMFYTNVDHPPCDVSVISPKPILIPSKIRCEDIKLPNTLESK